MNLSTVFAKMAMLILIMLLGYLCARIGITGPEFNKRVTPLMITVLLPATILNSVLGAISVRAALTDWRAYAVAAVRLLVCPLLTWAVLRPFVSGDLLGIPVLLAACPTAMLVTALCLQYDRSDAFASKCIFINTILSAATIPLVIWLLF